MYLSAPGTVASAWQRAPLQKLEPNSDQLPFLPFLFIEIKVISQFSYRLIHLKDEKSKQHKQSHVA